MPARRCLYDELEISQSSDDADIKRAYRVAALRWHPDKNRGDNEAEASERFKGVQHAYEVLSDPHERAWYDSHRESFIAGRSTDQGADDEAPSAGQATAVDLFSYFSASAYDGFDDAPESFYGVYGMVFSSLTAEERSAGASFSCPSFGGAESDWEEVRQFYSVYEGFSSRKPFGFADKWNLAEAPNRDYRRAMERENKRERARVKKEFNDLVRELVSFVKKRDPRVKARKGLEAERKGEREKAAEMLKTQNSLDRKARAADFRAQRDAVLDEDAEELDRILEQLQLDEELENGTRSRDRSRNAADDTGSPPSECHHDDLDSDADFGNRDESSVKSANSDVSTDEGDPSMPEGIELQGQRPHEVADSAEDSEEEDLYCFACKKLFRTQGQKQNHEQSKKHVLAAKKLRTKLMKEDALFAERPAPSPAEHSRDDSVARDESDEETTMPMPRKKDRKAARRRKQAQEAMFCHMSIEDSAEEMDAHESETSRSDQVQKRNETRASGGSDGGMLQNGERLAPDERSSKARKCSRRRQKKAAAQIDIADDASALVCNVCNASFLSRNKLFAHVKSEGHALYK